MGNVILIYGKSGSGKTRSLKNFGPEEIFLVNVTGKRPPFRKKFAYELVSNDVDKIKTALTRMGTKGIKTAVIDDAGYIMSDMFMKGHSTPKKGASSFDLYNDIADKFWGLIQFIRFDLPEDVNVYVMMHEDTDDYGQAKLRTIGKLLDQKCCIEGLATIVLRCMTEGTEHFFRVTTDGSDITKSPEDMFEAQNGRIENDLKAVDEMIRKYYEEDGELNGKV